MLDRVMTSCIASQASTQGIRVEANPFFLPEHSNPDAHQYVFAYRIRITNESDEPIKLLSRHWTIIDADAHREEVDGPGVVGETPRILPQEHYEYTSMCPLGTYWGTMEGSYRVTNDQGNEFDIEIGRFVLAAPELVPVEK